MCNNLFVGANCENYVEKRPGVNCAGVCSPQQQYRLVLVDTWWYWVSMKRYWLIFDGTGSVEGGTGWYLVVLGQWEAVLVGTWWYWVSRRRYWLVLGGTGWYLVVMGQ